MSKFVMSESQKELFLSGDEGRGEVRRIAAEENPTVETIYIVDGEDNLFGEVTGAEYKEEASVSDAIVLTDEQLEEQRYEAALTQSELDNLEAEIRPKVMSKLRDEAREEVRTEYRDIIRQLREDAVNSKLQIQKLTKGVNSGSELRAQLESDNTLLKMEVENLNQKLLALQGEVK